MVASRSRRRPLAVRLYVAIALILAFPTRIASQDLASLLTFQPSPAERAQGIFLSFSALRTATFSFPRPAGIAIPELPVVQVVARADRDPEITGSIPRRMSVAVPDAESDEPSGEPQSATVNREHKGDMRVRRVMTVATRSEPAEPPEVPPPAAEYDLSMSLEMDPGLPRPEDQPRPDRAGTLVDLKEEMPKQGVIAR